MNFEVFEGTTSDTFPIIRKTPDPYRKRLQAALAAINRPDYRAGMILWLGKTHPEMYRLVTSVLPDKIHDLWEARAPLADFDAILARLVESHQRACELYRQHLQKPSGMILEGDRKAEQAS